MKQQNTQQLHQEKQQKESVLQRGLNRVEQGFEQWQKNQEAKRLELERQQQLKQQQEQIMKVAQRSKSRSNDMDGPSLWVTKTT